MANKNDETVCKFNKYERNIMHAQAVNDVGGRVAYWIEDTEEDIRRCKERIEKRYADNAGDTDWKPEEDWNIRSDEQDMLKCKEVLALWKKLDAVLEKELAF